MKYSIAVLALLSVSAMANTNQERWFKAPDASKLVCDSTWGLSDDHLVIYYGKVQIARVPDEGRLGNICNAAKLSGVSETKPVYINLDTGDAQPEDGFFIHSNNRQQ